MTKHLPATRTTKDEASIWYELINLSFESEVNLGPGFPDFSPPDFVIQALVDSVKKTDGAAHQYTRILGHERLVKVVSELYGRLLGRHIDPLKEVVISLGAFNGLFCTIMGIINPGDEVIVFEPCYEAFHLFINMAGGTPVYVTMRPVKDGETISGSDWGFDMNEVKSKLTEKTKCIIINNPLNPLGKVFSRAELESLSRLAIENDLLVICDEVYEFMVYDDIEHVRIASLPDMWCRTLTVCSAGKGFGITGWRVGWVYGSATLMAGVQRMFSDVSRCCPTPTQDAVANLLEQQLPLLGTDECYFNKLSKLLQDKRNYLVESLIKTGFKPTVPQGGYFIVADYTKLEKNMNLQNNGRSKDVIFCSWMTRNKKIFAMPMTPFYSDEHKHLGDNYLRFCFTKETATLEKAEELLLTLNQ